MSCVKVIRFGMMETYHCFVGIGNNIENEVLDGKLEKWKRDYVI